MLPDYYSSLLVSSFSLVSGSGSECVAEGERQIVHIFSFAKGVTQGQEEKILYTSNISFFLCDFHNRGKHAP